MRNAPHLPESVRAERFTLATMRADRGEVAGPLPLTRPHVVILAISAREG